MHTSMILLVVYLAPEGVIDRPCLMDVLQQDRTSGAIVRGTISPTCSNQYSR